MSSLVAGYGSSSGDEDEEMETQQSASATPPTRASSGALRNEGGTSGEAEDGDDVGGSSLKLGSILPRPKGGVGGGGVKGSEIEVGPIPPKKSYGDEETPNRPLPSSSTHFTGFPGFAAKKSATGVTQITIPSLKDFEDEDDPKRSKKVFQAAKKGSGLFAILPEPKSEVTFRPPSLSASQGNGDTNLLTPDSEATANLTPTMKSLNLAKPKSVPLIPHVVHQSITGKRPAPPSERMAQVRAKYMKQESNFKIVSRNSAETSKVKKKNEDEDSEDEDEGPTDFFSLDAKPNDTFEGMSGMNSEEADQDLSLGLGQEYNEEIGMEEDEPLPAPSFKTTEPAQVPTTQPDLMQYIQPNKRGKAKAEPINIIDVNADDLRPASSEWLKTITDKSVIPPRRANLPGGMSKRKHQITYLAAEAKAREEELQNQWAQNRSAKRATQNKYGF